MEGGESQKNKSGMIVEFPPNNGSTANSAIGASDKPSHVKHSTNTSNTEGSSAGNARGSRGGDERGGDRGKRPDKKGN